MNEQRTPDWQSKEEVAAYIENIQRENDADLARWNAMRRRQEEIDRQFNAAVEQACEALAAPWRALADDIRRMK